MTMNPKACPTVGGVEICPDCKGVIYPFEREKTTSCLCVPADYEQCVECGFDHSYDPTEARQAHNLITWAASSSTEPEV
jgi:hypothetical protein